MSDEDVEKVWSEFWLPTMEAAIAERGGEAHLAPESGDAVVAMTPEMFDQIKRELFDLHSAIQVVPSVYSHATGGRMSKLSYNDVGQITGCIDEYYEEEWHATIAEALITATEDLEPGQEITPAQAVEIVLQHIQQACEVSDEDLEEARRGRLAVARLMAERTGE